MGGGGGGGGGGVAWGSGLGFRKWKHLEMNPPLCKIHGQGQREPYTNQTTLCLLELEGYCISCNSR